MKRILPPLLYIAGILLVLGAGLAVYAFSQPITDPSFEDLALRHSYSQIAHFVAFTGAVLLLVGGLVHRRASTVHHPAA